VFDAWDKLDFRTKDGLGFSNKEMLKWLKKFGINESIKESRVTHGSEELHKLNGMSKKKFAERYKGDGVDIFFMEDDTAVVSNRSSNLIHHGKDGARSLKLNSISVIYGGLEDRFYTPENWKKVLHSVYKGKRASVGTVDIKENKFIVDNRIVDEIKQSVKMGYDTIVVGKITPTKKGVMLVNDKYEVRGTYPLEAKDAIEKIIKSVK